MPICGCTPTVINQVVSDCTNCVIAKNYRYSCNDGPVPGGTTVVLDLTTDNDTTACGGAVTYSLVDYDSEGITNISITAGGSLSFDTTDNFTPYKEYLVEYRISCDNNSLSSTGKVLVCMSNPCGQCESQGGVCDPLVGTCLIQKDWAVTKVCGDTHTEDLTNANADDYILISFDENGFENVSIADVTNILSYDTLATAVPGNTYNIYYWVRTGSVYKKVKYSVTITDLCTYVVCASGEICDPCTGACIPNPQINIIVK